MMARPVALFTDFGVTGPYVGLMKAAVLQHSPQSALLDIMADAPMFDPRASAYLLAALLPYLPDDAVVLAVVDPGVGGVRHPLIVEADGRYLLGPDNGLFEMVRRRSTRFRSWRILWRPDGLSNTFHGRDLFAPLAACLARGESVDGMEVIKAELADCSQWPDDWPAVIYCDNYGNAMTGLRAECASPDTILSVGDSRLPYARTFSDVDEKAAFWTVNSVGLIELACNCGHADKSLGIKIGSVINGIG